MTPLSRALGKSPRQPSRKFFASFFQKRRPCLPGNGQPSGRLVLDADDRHDAAVREWSILRRIRCRGACRPCCANRVISPALLQLNMTGAISQRPWTLILRSPAGRQGLLFWRKKAKDFWSGCRGGFCNARPQEQKFFVSFFRTRTACLACHRSDPNTNRPDG